MSDPRALSRQGDTTRELRWEDEDGAKVLFTTDPDSCPYAGAVAIVAILEDANTGGVYITPDNARALITFLTAALKEADCAPASQSDSMGLIGRDYEARDRLAKALEAFVLERHGILTRVTTEQAERVLAAADPCRGAVEDRDRYKAALDRAGRALNRAGWIEESQAALDTLTGGR